MVPLEKVAPNNYNPNRMSPPKYKAFCEFVDSVGFMHPIAVAEPDKSGLHIIIDGEHRYRYLKDRGAKTVPVVILPKKFSGANVESMLASLRFNIHGEDDGIQLGQVYQYAVDGGYSADTLAGALGESVADVERVMSIMHTSATNDVTGDPPDEDGPDDSDEFVTVEFSLPKAVWEDIVEPEIQRVKRIAGINHDTDETIEFGQALELMAVMSSQTPDESIGGD